MPRPKNPELRHKILEEARRLFRENGYGATSYAEIAEAAGITKGLLQYYFPKKDRLACDLMTQVLEAACDALGYSGQPKGNDIAAYQQLYRIGQAFFAYLLRMSKCTQFLQDVTASFDLVDSVLAFDLQWAMEYTGQKDTETNRSVIETVVMTMGGFYALLHYDLSHDMEMDVRRHLRVVIREFMVATGFSDADATRALDAAEFDRGELDAVLERMKG